MTDPRVNSVAGTGDGTSLGLLDRARSNDPVAWDRVVRLYEPLVARWCRAAGVKEADLPDAVQDVFLAVDRKLGDYRRDRPRDTFRGWLRTVARSKAVDAGRRADDRVAAAGGSSAVERMG